MWAYIFIIKVTILVIVSWYNHFSRRSSMASGFIITFILTSFVDGSHRGIIFSSNECLWQWEAMDRCPKVAIGVASHGISCRFLVDFRWDPPDVMKADPQEVDECESMDVLQRGFGFGEMILITWYWWFVGEMIVTQCHTPIGNLGKMFYCTHILHHLDYNYNHVLSE